MFPGPDIFITKMMIFSRWEQYENILLPGSSGKIFYP
jgi:hypothetical protein